MRVSAMVEDLPPIAELDLNPVVVSASGCIVLDARIKVSMPRPAAPRPPTSTATDGPTDLVGVQGPLEAGTYAMAAWGESNAGLDLHFE